MAIRAQRQRVVTGSEEMIGLEGLIIGWENGHGTIRVHGETWHARSNRRLQPGGTARVEARDGLTLIVQPAQERSRP